MVIEKIRKMSVKHVKLKSESYFLLSPGVLELWRKTLGVQIGLKEKITENMINIWTFNWQGIFSNTYYIKLAFQTP